MSAKSAWVFDVTAPDFEAKVIDASQTTPVVVDFWAPWCGPCRALAPVLEKLVDARQGSVLLAKVNTDDEQDLAMKYRIDVLPTVIAFKNGVPVRDFVGVLPEYELGAFFDQLAPTDAERHASAAVEVEASSPGQAEKLYREALTRDPNLETALLGLARLLVARGEDAEAADLIERVGVQGAHGAEASKLSALIWLRQQAREAGDEKGLRARLDAEPKNAQARYEYGLRLATAEQHQAALDMLLAAGALDRKLAADKVREAMVKIFQIVGVRSELADSYRDKLSALLY